MVALAIGEDPAAVLAGIRKPGRPLIFVQNGIHSGEIEGKDACLMLARQLLGLGKGKGFPDYDAGILEKVDIVILPVLSVDAHERFGAFNRANQNGPKEMGWRATAQNYNLNRDYVKADAGETQALLPFINSLKPDFFIDNHTTDGGDWQYTMMFDVPKYATMHKAIVDWSIQYENAVMPMVDRAGWLTAPYFGRVNESGESVTIRSDTFGPRYSTGYMAMRNTPSLLVESHVLKPYKDRLLATAELNFRSWEWCARNAESLMAARRAADAETKAWKKGATATLASRSSEASVPWTYRGFETKPYQSDVSGGTVPGWTKTPLNKPGRWFGRFVPAQQFELPAGYVVPQEWTDIVARLRWHGVTMRAVESGMRVTGTVTRFRNVRFATAPFEGRFAPSFETVQVQEPVEIRPGDFFVPVGQELGRLVIQLLEPEAGDSLMKWGFFNAIFEEKEYAEAYAMEPYARKMLAEDPALRAEFEQKLKDDPAFAGNPSARLRWFFERSPFFDKNLNRYPVVALSSAP